MTWVKTYVRNGIYYFPWCYVVERMNLEVSQVQTYYYLGLNFLTKLVKHQT